MKTINKEFNPNDQTTWVSNELQAEVEKLGKQSKATSAKIDLKESYSGIETFDADLVMNELNDLATFHENLSVKFQQKSKDNLNNSATYWAESADGHYQAAKDVRSKMTWIIRTQKSNNRIRNYGV